jgi:hypothetical protein
VIPNETTAQNASGSTIAPSGDLRVDQLFHADATAGSSAGAQIGSIVWANDARGVHQARGRGRCRPRGRADAPTGPWKTADGFPQRPPPSSIPFRRENYNAEIRDGQ